MVRRRTGVEDIILTQFGPVKKQYGSDYHGRSFAIYELPNGMEISGEHALCLRKVYAHNIYEHYRALEAGRW